MRKPASDSIQGRIDSAISAQTVYQSPEGLPDLTELETTAWKQYIAHKNEWKDSELRQLHALVKMETKLTDMESEAAVTPFTFQASENSMIKEHPIHGMVSKQRNDIRSQLRVMGLNSPHDIARKNANEGRPSAGRGKAPLGKVSLLK